MTASGSNAELELGEMLRVLMAAIGQERNPQPLFRAAEEPE